MCGWEARWVVLRAVRLSGKVQCETPALFAAVVGAVAVAVAVAAAAAASPLLRVGMVVSVDGEARSPLPPSPVGRWRGREGEGVLATVDADPSEPTRPPPACARAGQPGGAALRTCVSQLASRCGQCSAGWSCAWRRMIGRCSWWKETRIGLHCIAGVQCWGTTYLLQALLPLATACSS
jgi:hypothetical protein